MTRQAIVWACAAISIAILSLTMGCNGGKLPPGNRNLVLQLNWTPDPTFSGEYLALDQGFWSDHEGLKVRIQVGGFGIDPFAPVVARKAEFAVVGADKAAIAFANGAPIRVVAVDLQRNPVGWIARSDSRVQSIPDLAGRTDLVLGDKIGTETTAILQLMLGRTGLLGKIQPKGVGFDLAYFLQNPNIVYPVYLNEEPFRARRAGLQIIEIDPADQENGGVRLYGNVLITHRNLIEEQEQTVKGFVSGLRRGWEYARDSREKALQTLRKRPEFASDTLDNVFDRSVEFATSAYGVRIPPGHMEASRWQETLAALKEGGVLKSDVDVNKLVWFGADEH